MEKTTIIVAFPCPPGSDAPYAQAMALEAGASGRSVALALAVQSGSGPGRAADDPDPGAAGTTGGRGPLRLSLRPGSSLSARSVFLESANALGPAGELVLVLEPGSAGRPILGSPASGAEAFAEERVMACFRLLREAEQRLGKLPGASVAFALPEEPRAPGLSGFSLMERDFFLSLGCACMAESAMGGRVFGLRGGARSPRGFAKALLSLLDDPKARGAGRWSGKKGGFL